MVGKQTITFDEHIVVFTRIEHLKRYCIDKNINESDIKYEDIGDGLLRGQIKSEQVFNRLNR